MTLSYGTANQVQYLNGSKQLVGDADLTFDGTTLSVAAINATTLDLTNIEVTNIKAKGMARPYPCARPKIPGLIDFPPSP